MTTPTTTTDDTIAGRVVIPTATSTNVTGTRHVTKTFMRVPIINPAFNKWCPNNRIIEDSVRDYFLLKHNALREELAQGLVSTRNGTVARKAMQMIRLTYDCDAEKSAYDWASKCLDRDSTQTTYSENRYTINDTSVTVAAAAYESVSIWWDEVRNTNMQQMAGQSNLYYSYLNLRHFAKMAWDTQRTLGCAVVECSNFVNVVCHYTGANIAEGSPIYEMGPPCAGCVHHGTSTCVSGLCKLN